MADEEGEGTGRRQAAERRKKRQSPFDVCTERKATPRRRRENARNALGVARRMNENLAADFKREPIKRLDRDLV